MAQTARKQTAQKQAVTVGGHKLTLTNLDKVLYPETGTTKRDVLAYYAAVADVLIPHAAERPVTRKRWVHGVGTPGDPGEVFFEKNLPAAAPEWVQRHSIEHTRHTIQYPMLNDLATLTWLGQVAALEIHVPQWRFGTDGGRLNPDRLVLDLDPGEGADLRDCAEVAVLARSILTDMGMDPMPVTSGSKGIHLYAALDGSQTSERVSEVAHELARALEADHPDLIVSDMKKSLRSGKVLVDWSQNNAAKTTITPYSLRGRFRPTVAAPRTWRELTAKNLQQLDYEEVLRRVERRGDPLAELSARASGDRLARYRSMRDAGKTPEPIPAEAAAPSTGSSFVIQEHHASRLHWDFRLERDGVLVSWALPKGVPTEVAKNHLAVQTEDHPLEYGGFEGSIPKGEYGAGDVTIWDSGDYELEKWRDGKEVIVLLHGTKPGGLGGDRKVALIRTGGEGKDASNWLIHLMKDSPGVGGAPAKAAPNPVPVKAASKGMPKRVAPMLATAGDAASLTDDDEWAFEMKWDGIRAIAVVGGDRDGDDKGADGGARLLTRNGNDVTATYPEIVSALPGTVEESAVLDGEIVAINSKGRPDFGLLQTRMGLTRAADVRGAALKAPVQYLVFDILEADGRRLTAEPYDERRRVLEETVRSTGSIQVPPAFEGELEEAVDSSRELGLEGVMAKKRDSTYAVGRRSKAWVKIKHHVTQEVVVGGWRPGKGRRENGIGSLLLGIPGEDGLLYVGRVGTGFGDRDLNEIAARLRRRVRKTSPFVDVPRVEAVDAHWVSPTLVGEVQFAEWTSTGRLRQPSWRGWRPDKDPDDVVRES